jgi:hypothetical protein
MFYFDSKEAALPDHDLARSRMDFRFRGKNGHAADISSLEPIRTLARDAFEASRSLTALEQDARHRAAIGKRAPASVPGK